MAAGKSATVGVYLFVAVCLAGCDGVRIPVSFEVSIPLAQHLSVPPLEGVPVGSPIPSGQSVLELPLCNLPTEKQMARLARHAAGGLAAQAFEMDRLELVAVHVTAELGDFATVTGVGLTWWPSAPDGEPVDLGFADSEAGFGTELVVEPPESVDLLALAAQEDAGFSPECPEIQVQLMGLVPETMPVCSIVVKARVEGAIGLF